MTKLIIDLTAAPPTAAHIKECHDYAEKHALRAAAAVVASIALALYFSNTHLGAIFLAVCLGSLFYGLRTASTDGFDCNKPICSDKCKTVKEWMGTNAQVKAYCEQVFAQKRELIELEYTTFKLAIDAASEQAKRNELYNY